MTLDSRTNNNHVDAISMVANQMKIDLSATIKPQDKIDTTKAFDVKQHANAVGASLQETATKASDLTQIEKTLHQQLEAGGPEQIMVGDLGQQRPGGLTNAMGKTLMAGLGIAIPPLGAAMLVGEAVGYATKSVPGVHEHAGLTTGGPSAFKDPVGRSSTNAEAEPSVYGDAMGGQWNFRTGFEVTNTPAPKAGPQTQYDRDMQQAAKNTIGVLGAEAVREDLGQIGETKKRLGQQGRAALDEAEEIYGIKPESAPQAQYAVAPPKGAVAGGPRGPFG